MGNTYSLHSAKQMHVALNSMECSRAAKEGGQRGGRRDYTFYKNMFTEPRL